MSNLRVGYKGIVTIAHKRGSRVASKRTIHNAGMPDIAQMFAKAAAGVWEAEGDSPRLLDIGYIVDSSDNYAETEKRSVWQSILNNPVPIGGRQFSFNKDENNWVATLTSTVLYSDLNGAILDKALQNADDEKIQLQIRLCSYPELARKYFAKVDISADDIRKIQDTTSALVTWVMELVLDDTYASTFKGNIKKN